MAEETRVVAFSKSLLSKYLGEDVVDKILQPTDKSLIRWRKIGGGKLAPYVKGSDFILRLNECFGFLWSQEIVESKREGDHIVVRGRLTFEIPGVKETITKPDGTVIVREVPSIRVVKEQFGGSEVKRYKEDSGTKYKAGDLLDLANDYKAASTDCMKKCAVQTGLFIDVYSTAEEAEGSVTKRASGGQLSAVMLRGKRLGWSEEEVKKWSKDQTNLDWDEMEPLDAMGLLPKLMDLEKEKK